MVDGGEGIRPVESAWQPGGAMVTTGRSRRAGWREGAGIVP